jgi:hypothetical protein
MDRGFPGARNVHPGWPANVVDRQIRNLRRDSSTTGRPRFIATASSAQTRRASNCALLANPTIAFLSTDKVVGNLLRRVSAGDCNPMPRSLLVIDEDMRTRTLNSPLSFESHSIAAGCVTNLSTHLCVTGWPKGVLLI